MTKKPNIAVNTFGAAALGAAAFLVATFLSLLTQLLQELEPLWTNSVKPVIQRGIESRAYNYHAIAFLPTDVAASFTFETEINRMFTLRIQVYLCVTR